GCDGPSASMRWRSPRSARSRRASFSRKSSCACSSARAAVSGRAVQAAEKAPLPRSSTARRSRAASSARRPQTKRTRLPPLYRSWPSTTAPPTSDVRRGWVPLQACRSKPSASTTRTSSPASSGTRTPRRAASSRARLCTATGRPSQTTSFARDSAARTCAASRARARWGADGGGRGGVNERAREQVLAVVLLQVVAAPLAVDLAVDRLRRRQRVHDVQDLAAALDDRRHVRGVQPAGVPGLAAALGVERGAVEHHRGTALVLAPRDHARVELQQVGIVAVEEDGGGHRHQSGAMLSTYLKPVPVVKETTTSAAERWPAALSLRSAATQAPPSGAMNNPSVAAASFTPWMISASDTATAAPWLWRSPRRIRKPATGLGPRRPWACVVAPSQNSASSRPSANAFTI